MGPPATEQRNATRFHAQLAAVEMTKTSVSRGVHVYEIAARPAVLASVVGEQWHGPFRCPPRMTHTQRSAEHHLQNRFRHSNGQYHKLSQMHALNGSTHYQAAHEIAVVSIDVVNASRKKNPLGPPC